MDFKTFFFKKIMMSFYVSVTFISAAMAVIGLIFESDTRFGYEAFISPLLFGAIASFPLLIKYSKHELSMKQALIRNLMHFIILEVLILTVLFIGGLITTVSLAVSAGISILFIDLTVNLVMWINDKNTAKHFNDALKKWQDIADISD